jgi:toxin ParE1/3/4
VASPNPIVWSPEAERDILDIWNYWAREAAIEVADNLLRAIDKVCTRLQEWPNSGRKRDELVAGLRSVPAPPNVIFYRVRLDTVEIVRVLDGRRDIDAIFSDA